MQKGYRIKVFNTINFKKSMHYNPLAYVHSEKDILKLVTALMTNTKGEGQGGDPFWEKAERLLLVALIAYLHEEAPTEEQNFATLLEMLNTMQVSEEDESYQNPVDLLFEQLEKRKPNSFAGRQYRLYKLAAGKTVNTMQVSEEDESYQNPVDLLFEQLEKRKPNSFAGRQYRLYKLAAGKTAKSILISCGARLAPFDIQELREIMEKRKPNSFAGRQYRLYKLAAGKTAKSILISCGARLAPFDIQELREITAYDELELDTGRQYRLYKLAAGKTAKSILISCGARLAPFDIQELREITAYDELELDTLGDRKTVLFLIMSDTDSTFNFLISMVYTQLFNLLCDKADDMYGGRLPVHVRCLIDECANIGQIPNLEKLAATIRSREISACLVLQARSQLKALYKDNADTIIGNMDSQIFLGGSEPSTLKELSEMIPNLEKLAATIRSREISACLVLQARSQLKALYKDNADTIIGNMDSQNFLGGSEPSTLKELSEMLGKDTIDQYNTSDTRGNSPSYGTTYQKLGRELMSRDELAVLDGGKGILQLRGVRPFLSDKYDLTQHPYSYGGCGRF